MNETLPPRSPAAQEVFLPKNHLTPIQTTIPLPTPSKPDPCHICRTTASSSVNLNICHCILCNRTFCSRHVALPDPESPYPSPYPICSADHEAYKKQYWNFPRVYATLADYEEEVKRWKEGEERVLKDSEEFAERDRQKRERKMAGGGSERDTGNEEEMMRMLEREF